ncbi:hypothetical protein, partial [Actinomadura harenae]
MTDRSGSGPDDGGSTGDDASAQAPAVPASELDHLPGDAPGDVADHAPVRVSGTGREPEPLSSVVAGSARAAVDGLGEVTRGLAPVAERAARGASA